MKGYLASHFFDTFGFEGTKRLAEKIRKETGIDLYVPQENSDINDKTKEGITEEAIFLADYERLKEADILIACIDGVEIDSGVACEIGLYTGLIINEKQSQRKIIGLYSDMRRYGDGYNRMYKNLFVKGAILKHGVLCSSEDEIIREIREV